MKRFGVCTLVVLIAIMDFGYAKLGFAQTEDEPPVPISGASGRSVRANVWYAEWTWTAPATGPSRSDTDPTLAGSTSRCKQNVSHPNRPSST